jgi:hypothetical protein
MDIPFSPIRQFSGAIRDHVNKPWKNYLLRQNYALFLQLCSSMDMVDDADDAIRAFEAGKFDHDRGGLYLATCGVLQALVVQQEAVSNLAEALDYRLNFIEIPALAEIREIRHLSFGHPTKKDRPKSKGVSYNHIIQVSLSPIGFELLSFMPDETTKHRYVNILSLISAQTDSLAAVLEEIVDSLNKEQSLHKEHFREEKLTPIFHPSIDYHCTKVVEAAYRDDEPEFGLINLRIVLKASQDFRDAVGRRNMDFYDSLEHEYRLIHHAAGKLSAFFEARIAGGTPAIEQLSAEIFAEFISAQIRSLVQYAKEIDEDYDSRPRIITELITTG